ncbi:hypothetical protein [Muriicola sp. Z0-33]|uniref:hypothetical protein n=1 Tax=Muriicola sp. Z0-33 TaxID=2816957 RepID=UPI0022371812|nr:hypothetical protein [Muriicola sp. Z0-33]MCW5514754.1 hypothetical protein [Muriicola sp. Z0-33]
MVIKVNNFKNLFLRRAMRSVLFLLFIVSIACSSDGEEEKTIGLEGTNLSMSDIAGSWLADQAVITEVGNPSNSVDIIGEGGSVSLNILSNGRFTSLIDPVQLSGLELQGQMGFDGASLVIIEDGFDIEDAAYYTVSLDAQDRLHLNGELEFPISAGGGFVPTSIDLRMIRQ